MSANVSSLLTLNPIIVYATLALYGLLFALMFLYLHTRFRTASRVLTLLKTDWAAANMKHSGLVESAQGQIAQIAHITKMGRLSESAARNQSVAAPSAITVDVRGQVVAMGKKGCDVAEISRATGLPEGEVDVLLGLARMQR